MEVFKGNGAECMVRFIADGKRGKIVAEDEKTIVQWGGKTGVIWLGESYGHMWLYENCTYTPPEPVYRVVTSGQALDLWLEGKTIQRRGMTLDEAFADRGNFCTMEPRTVGGKAQLWNAFMEYRVLCD